MKISGSRGCRDSTREKIRGPDKKSGAILETPARINPAQGLASGFSRVVHGLYRYTSLRLCRLSSPPLATSPQSVRYGCNTGCHDAG